MPRPKPSPSPLSNSRARTRNCLKCGEPFPSESRGNRICPDCNRQNIGSPSRTPQWSPDGRQWTREDSKGEVADEPVGDE